MRSQGCALRPPPGHNTGVSDKRKNNGGPSGDSSSSNTPLPLRRRILFWGITLCVGLVGALAVGELAARLIRGRDLTPEQLAERLHRSERTEVEVVTTGNLGGIVKPSAVPDIVYELKPSRRWVFQSGVTRTNSHGFRGEEWTARRPAGTLRVVGIGDSVMWGWGVDQDLIYTARLERSLLGALGGSRVEVLNCACPGYNTVQEVATLEHRCLQFEPNAVLVGFVRNDWTAPFFVRDPAGGRLVSSSVLARWIEEGKYDRRQGTRPSLEQYEGTEKAAASLRHLADLARQRSLPVVFFVAPDVAADPGAAPAPEERLARDLGFIVVDVDGALRRRRPLHELVLSRQDSHPNAEGHRLIAEALRPAVLEALKARLAAE